MPIIHSKQHKEIVGSVNDAPYTVSFDADGFAEVDEAVAAQLTSGNYGVVLIDEDGAEVAQKASESGSTDESKDNSGNDQTVPEKTSNKRKKSEGSEAE